MLRVGWAIVALAATVGTLSATTVEAQSWNQIWSDEFSAAPSDSNWNFETGGGGWGNNERQYLGAAEHPCSLGGE